MRQSKYFNFDIFIIVLLSCFSLLLWWPTRYLPFHWDAAGYIAFSAKAINDQGLPGLFVTNSDFAHPPLLPGLIAFVWRYFGSAPYLTHLLLYPFLPLLSLSVYFYLKSAHNRSFALLVSLITLTVPITLAEYGNIYPDLPAASCLLASLMFLKSRRFTLSAIFLLVAVLFKEIMLLYLPLYFLKSPGSKISLKLHLYTVLPAIIALSGWFIWHYQQTGFWFLSPDRSLVKLTSLGEILTSLKYVFSRTFLSQGRFVLVIPALFLIAYRYLHRLPLSVSPQLNFFGLGILLPLFFYSFSGEFALRYGIFPITLLLILTSLILWYSFSAKSKSFLFKLRPWIFTAFILVQLYFWRPNTTPSTNFELRPPEDISYQDQIHIFRQLGAYVSLLDSQAEFFGGFPENIYLTQPFLGYVKDPIDFSICTTFVLKPAVTQYLIRHPYSPDQILCQDLYANLNPTLVRHFSKNSMWVELYAVTPAATLSALPKSRT